MSNPVTRRIYVNRPENIDVALVLDQVKHLETEIEIPDVQEDGTEAFKTVRVPINSEDLLDHACEKSGVWHSLTIKAWSRNDREELEAAITNVDDFGVGKRDDHRFQSMLIQKAVLSWSLRKDNLDMTSEPLPITEQSFNGLSDSLSDTIATIVESCCYPPKVSGRIFFPPSKPNGVSGG